MCYQSWVDSSSGLCNKITYCVIMTKISKAQHVEKSKEVTYLNNMLVYLKPQSSLSLPLVVLIPRSPRNL